MPSYNPYLLISADYPPHFIGGSRVWMYNLIENCPENFDILTVSLPEGETEACSPRHRIFRKKWVINSLDPTRFQLLRNYIMIPLWLIFRFRKTRYRAVMINTGAFGIGLFCMIGKLFGIPIIGVANGEEITLAQHAKGFGGWIKRLMLYKGYPLAKGFVGVSQFCTRLLVGLGVNENTIVVIPSCVNPKKKSKLSKKTTPGFNVLSVGRLVERKGFHSLIEGAQLLRNDIPGLKVTIVGSGPMEPKLDSLIEKYQLQNHVEVKTDVSDEELSKLYVNSDVFVLAHMVLPNGDTEGCPTVFSEAAGVGLPIIGGTGAGADTAINEGVNGYIVNSRDIRELSERIKFLLLNPDVANKMGEAGIKKVAADHDPVINGRRLGEFLGRYK